MLMKDALDLITKSTKKGINSGYSYCQYTNIYLYLFHNKKTNL